MSDPNNPMSVLNHLPPDLIEAILPFLPDKSLGRFKSVSKRWYSLISTPNFIKSHILNYTKNYPNPSPTQLILVPELCYDVYSVNLKQLNTQTTPATAKRLKFRCGVGILGSCNGLLLTYDAHYNLYLVNLTTEKGLKIPGGGSVGAHGFGYDPSTDDYKVVVIDNKDSDPNHAFVRVYSLRKNSWNTNFPYQQNYFYGQGVLFNNNLHWVVRNKHSTITIAVFSLANEEFHEIELPDIFNCGIGKSSQVFVLGGKLVAILLFVNEFWVLEEYGVPKSWTKRCVFENIMLYLCYEYFAQVSNRDVLLVDNNKAEEFFIYNMDERRYETVKLEGCQEGFKFYGTYVESLESLERFR